MTYAMVEQKNNTVIEIVKSNTLPSFPQLHDKTSIVAIECDENVKRGWVYDFESKTFCSDNPLAVRDMLSNVSEMDLAIFEIQVNTEYLVCLAELSEI